MMSCEIKRLDKHLLHDDGRKCKWRVRRKKSTLLSYPMNVGIILKIT